jgi:integrase
VFPNPESESGHIEYSTYRDSWQQAKKIAKITRKLDMKEVIRHTSATMSIERGSPLPVESRYLGHSSTKTTETYYFRPSESLYIAGDITAKILTELVGINPDGTPMVDHSLDLLLDSSKNSDDKLM